MNDRERLEDVEHVLHGDKGSGAAKNMGYAVYVTVLLASTYGFTVARAVFATSGPAWIDDHVLTLPTAVIGVGLFVASLALARWAGRTRGPVVPPLPWTDLVASSDVDRARSLRRWWTYAFVGGLVGGAILGAVIGGGVWASGAGSAGWFVGAVPIGAAAGWLLARMWLEGQVAPDTSGTATLARVVRPAAGSLRQLRLDDLRSHGVRSTQMGGGVLAGDLRAVRLEVASPVTRGRRLRLQAAGPRAVVVRRDILGLRRAPGAFWTGAVLVVIGWAGVVWALTDPRVPVALTCLAMAACYLGMGAWAEGLRLLGDNAGTPPMLGLRFRTEAIAHLVVPVALFLMTTVGVSAIGLMAMNNVGVDGAGLSSAGPNGAVPILAVLGWCLLIGTLLAGAQLMAAFRGAPPVMAFLPEYGPPMMIYWYARPLVLASVSGGLIVSHATAGAAASTAAGSGMVTGMLIALVTAIGAMAWGLRSVKTLEEAHRI